MSLLDKTQSIARERERYEKRWYVYIIECTADSGRVTLHVGIALDVHKRLEDHRAGKVKATRGRSIRLMGYTSNPKAHGDALAIEHMLKQFTPADKLAMVAKWNKVE